MRGIVMHWTAGQGTVSAIDRDHYHFIVARDGAVVPGVHAPEDNLNTADDDYAAHTRGANTGRIGVAVAGMLGAQERPFKAGKTPISWPQINAMTALVARLCAQYNIPVTRQTVLTHAEVQPTLGIAQSGKWDICWLPGMKATGNAIEIGDRLRADVLKNLNKGQ